MREWLLCCVPFTKRDNACAEVAYVPHESERGEATATADWLPLLIRMRWPAIGLCVAAAVANGAEWVSGNAELSARFVAPVVLWACPTFVDRLSISFACASGKLVRT